MLLNQTELQDFIRRALEEDVREGDHTSLACVPAEALDSAKLLVKEAGVLAGVPVAREVFKAVDPSLEVQVLMQDGATIAPGDIVLTVKGKAVSILTAERLVLNCMQRMSGIATLTKKYVDAVAGTGAKVIDTRKTTPGIRMLEKYAVTVGGGSNHRMGLYDMIMIKDNHVDFSGGIALAIDKVHQYLKAKQLDLRIEVETRNLDELHQVLDKGGIHRIMLDNYSPELLKEAVAIIGGRYETEASGGIKLDNIRAYALTGVNFISIGALTHSAVSLDLSLKAVRG